MKTVTIYTDGACSGNPGPGGWGAILMYGPHKKEMSGGEAQTTNNRMELTGAISALRALKEPCQVELYSDSKYVIDALEKGWAKGWRAGGWVKGDKKPALNPDLWARLLDLCLANSAPVHPGLVEKYRVEDAAPLTVDRERVAAMGLELEERPLASDKGDFARHDPDKLAAALLEIYRRRAVRIFRGERRYILEE